VSGTIHLGAVAARISTLNVGCNRCARVGRLRIDRLLAESSPDLLNPDLRRIVAADCPKPAEPEPIGVV
jgi:hypothetical protein